MNSAIYLHAITPVHAGTGQASASDIDLPIAREKATNWPVLPGTSLKGVLRAATPEDQRDALFGRDGNRNGTTEEERNTKPGNLQIGDARLLCFPVRSWQGVFAYVTCPFALSRLSRDFAALGIAPPFKGDIPTVDGEAVFVPAGSRLKEGSEIWLEDLQLTAAESGPAQEIAEGLAAAVFADKAEQTSFASRFGIVSDEIFDFLAETATQVDARISLESDTKKVKPRALWYEESVPAEAIFVAAVLGDALPALERPYIQIGGNSSVGRGLCRVTIQAKEA